MKPKPKSPLGIFWDALSPLSRKCAVLIPIFGALALLTPYAASMIGTPPFANKAVELRVVQVEQRMNLSESLQIQREILKLEEEARRRKLTEAEKNYLEDLKSRLKQLERK